ncbi:DUF402 domain-containing protein [Deinococcus sp. KNUC1210]|uniref:DUF402 domain-containing protein n=1 Tax=Deinococcus sp. KNUC1210 TaxID=2917691 RepID=UPI001EF01783|nr:DUF402 domain-containing protein [Deinococcus sp. KNUC1210]ULH16114.1 DUF402 domain-containing protein [Deinococcus sp. KNUC1210]
MATGTGSGKAADVQQPTLNTGDILSLHPVKTEQHDLRNRLHHTNTGIRPVDLYRETPHGLYVSRRFVDHPRIAYWQAHLLPGLFPGVPDGTAGMGVQLCRYDFHSERVHDYYLDIATIQRQDDVWTVRDHYLDLLVWDGLCAEIADTDELSAAHQAGYISDAELHAALHTAHAVLNGLARHGYEMEGWLTSLGFKLAWDLVDSGPHDPATDSELTLV